MNELTSSTLGQRIEASLPVVRRRSPRRGDPAFFFQSLQGGIQRPMFDQEFVVRGLLDCARDTLPMLRAKNERTQNEHVERALHQRKTFSPSGRHLTQASINSGQMSTRSRSMQQSFC